MRFIRSVGSRRIVGSFLRIRFVEIGLVLATLVGCSSTFSDSDSDGVSDRLEGRLGTDPNDQDTDGDGLFDGAELEGFTSPLHPDSDGDGRLDGEDPVTDSPSRVTTPISSGNDVEPNNSVDDAVALSAAGNARLTLLGRIDQFSDVDLFHIGELRAGDSVTVDLLRDEGTLVPAVALFDAEEVLVDLAWPVGRTAEGGLPGLLSTVIHHASHTYLLAITRRPDEGGLGGYQLDVLVERAGPKVAPRPQTVYLDFDGGRPEVPLLGVRNVEAFDAGRISALYAGKTETIKQAIVETVRENFAGFQVFVVTSDESTVIDRRSVSTLLIGSYNRDAFGVSEGVDSYNTDPCDDGMVFAESFVPGVFGFVPRAELIGVAIGNVASHEIGHLLGLRHVGDPTALMDERSPAVSLLRGQEFKKARLAPSVFPLGWQDDRRLLAEAVGRQPD